MEKTDSGPSYVVLNPRYSDEFNLILSDHIYSVSEYDEKSEKCLIQVNKKDSIWVGTECLLPAKVILKWDYKRFERKP